MHFVALVWACFGWFVMRVAFWLIDFWMKLKVLVCLMMSNDISSWAVLMTGWWYAVGFLFAVGCFCFFRGSQLPQLSDWLTGWLGDCFRWALQVQYLVVDIGIVHRFLGLSAGSLGANVAAIAMLQCCSSQCCSVAVSQFCSSLYLGLVLPGCYLCNLSCPQLCVCVFCVCVVVIQ